MEQQGGDISQRRESILGKSPLLKAFLGKSPTMTQDIVKSMTFIGDEFKRRFGEKYNRFIIRPMSIAVHSSLVFGRNANITFFLVEMLTDIGYELGNPDNINVFLEEIVDKLTNLNAVNPKILNINTIGIITGIIYAGYYLRNLDINQINENQSPDDDIPQAFKDFLRGLDLDF